MFTAGGVVVAEWAEWNPATVAEVDTLFPTVGPGDLVQVRHAIPPGGKTPWVTGLKKIGTLP